MTLLHQPVQFFAAARKSLFGGALTTPQVDGLNQLTKAMGAANWPIADTAYGLATAYHEVDRTMQPIRERGNGDRDKDGVDDWFEQYDTGRKAATLGNTPAADGDGAKWCGRGYCQVTGFNNYSKVDAALGLDGALIADPTLMLQPRVAAPAMVVGMQTGMFTGKRNADYLPRLGRASTAQFTQARRIINGVDAADKIAGYAILFQKCLEAGAWH